MPETKLSRRLRVAFLLVNGGGRVCDVGTDHALLPIALVKSGKAKSAIASDINPKPLEKARENIQSEGLENKIELVLTDGVHGLEGRAEEYVIAGMGGELIATIIEQAPFLKNKDVHLVLQPMTKVSHLREFLWENGFEILEEVYLFEAHYYTVMSVCYQGSSIAFDEIDALLGKDVENKVLAFDDAVALIGIVKEKLCDFDKKINGKKLSGQPTEVEEKTYSKLCEILKKLERKYLL